jgi:WD40 repeat protein
MRHDEMIRDFGPGPADIGPKRGRIGRPRFRPWTRGRIAWLLAAAIGAPWHPALQSSPESPAMHRSRGRPGVAVRGFALGPDGQTIATADGLERVTMRRAASRWDIDRSFKVRGATLAFSPDGRSLVVGGGGFDVVSCDLAREGREHPLGIPIRQISDLRFSPDGRTLAVSSFRTSEVILWDTDEGKLRMILRGHSSSVVTMAFAPDGQSLASTARTDSTVLIWDLATGEPRCRLSAPGVVSLAYSPDGRLLATVGIGEKSVRIWDARRGGLLRRTGGHPLPILSVSFSPDARWLATGAGDGSAGLWDVATGREIRRLDGRADVIVHVAFSPDGRMLAAIGNDDDIRIWDLAGLIGETAKP